MGAMGGMVEEFQEALTSYGPNLVAAAVILLLGWSAAKLLGSFVRRMMRRAEVDPTLVAFVGSLTYIAVLTLVVIAALGKLGVNTTSFAAVVAAAGLAIGFALQGSLANFAAGIMLILFRPFKVGDFVEAADVSGVVEEVQMFATVLKTPDNKQIIIPNASITGGSITNYSAKDVRRVDLVFGISYEDDIKLAKTTVEAIFASDDRILKDPPPTIGVLELADSSVNLAVRPWVRMADYWDVFFALNERVKLEFDAREISIPFPQRDVHMTQAA
jgi:small conductance mechanosensitive channel